MALVSCITKDYFIAGHKRLNQTGLKSTHSKNDQGVPSHDGTNSNRNDLGDE